MKRLADRLGLSVRLTDERLAHVLEHPEMAGMENAIADALRDPEHIVESFSDPTARLYYRLHEATPVGRKYLCVVVKAKNPDPFVITAYLTDRPKRGVPLWPSDA